MKKNQYVFLAATILLVVSCSQKEPNIPKPRAYPRVDRSDSLLFYTTDHFKFQYSIDANLTSIPADKEGQVWFNISYPRFKATLYCSFARIKTDDLLPLLSDNRKFILNNTYLNVRVVEQDYSISEMENVGALYYFDGNSISPYQFYLTDNKSYFLRGSLHYTDVVQTDSILPTTLSLKKDITILMESFQNKSLK